MNSIETGRLKRNKGSHLEKEVSYKMIFLDDGYLRKIMGLQDIIVRGLPDPEIFWAHPVEYFREIFEVERSVIGVLTEDGLVAYSLIYIPEEGKALEGRENLGQDMNLSSEDLRRAAHLQATIVHPDYRGNSLQRRMAEHHLDVLEKKGYEHILCTISPKNPFSLKNIMSCGLTIKGLKIKFNGWWRYIMYKNISYISHPIFPCPDGVRIRGSDIEGQIDLLSKGFIGCRMEMVPGDYEVFYCRDNALIK